MTVFGMHFEVMPQHRIPVLGFPYQQEEKKKRLQLAGMEGQTGSLGV